MIQPDDTRYVLFVDDVTEGFENHEYHIEASSAEEACLLGQEAFPYGIIRAVVSSEDLEEADQWRTRAAKKRAEENRRLKRVWGNAFDLLGKANNL